MLFKAKDEGKLRTIIKCCKQCKKYNTVNIVGYGITHRSYFQPLFPLDYEVLHPLTEEEIHTERLGANALGVCGEIRMDNNQVLESPLLAK